MGHYCKGEKSRRKRKEEREKIESQYAKVKESDVSKIEEGKGGHFDSLCW